MNAKDYLTYLFPKTLQYRASRFKLLKPGNPITLTYSVTAACQSQCKTCHIGLKYKQDPTSKEKDLKVEELEKIFITLGHVYFFNISGGEPFLRDDLPKIIELACRYLKPRIIHVSTNAISSERIRDLTIQCLEIINESYDSSIPFTLKPSVDGVGDVHDEIRGVRDNFKQLEKTLSYLKDIGKEYSNLHIELGTIISNFNIDHLSEIEDYVHSLGIESYRHEIAEQRTEFFNLNDPITPNADTYERLIRGFVRKIRETVINKKRFTKITESFRLVYYDLAVKILREERQVIPCYGGISNAHINYDGEVWPCCVLGYKKPLGFLREQNYDFQKVWHSDRANVVRKYIKDRNCACVLANQAYSNILHSPTYLFKTLQNFLRFHYRQGGKITSGLIGTTKNIT
ncbi:MAG: radical SAM protein [Gemmatimonadota bacterium]|nr:MAG: radical SAM protein [Gemmatimonadota bacterium]